MSTALSRITQPLRPVQLTTKGWRLQVATIAAFLTSSCSLPLLLLNFVISNRGETAG